MTFYAKRGTRHDAWTPTEASQIFTYTPSTSIQSFTNSSFRKFIELDPTEQYVNNSEITVMPIDEFAVVITSKRKQALALKGLDIYGRQSDATTTTTNVSTNTLNSFYTPAASNGTASHILDGNDATSIAYSTTVVYPDEEVFARATMTTRDGSTDVIASHVEYAPKYDAILDSLSAPRALVYANEHLIVSASTPYFEKPQETPVIASAQVARANIFRAPVTGLYRFVVNITTTSKTGTNYLRLAKCSRTGFAYISSNFLPDVETTVSGVHLSKGEKVGVFTAQLGTSMDVDLSTSYFRVYSVNSVVDATSVDETRALVTSVGTLEADYVSGPGNAFQLTTKYAKIPEKLHLNSSSWIESTFANGVKIVSPSIKDITIGNEYGTDYMTVGYTGINTTVPLTVSGTLSASLVKLKLYTASFRVTPYTSPAPSGPVNSWYLMRPTFLESTDSDSLFSPVLNGILYTGSVNVLAQVFFVYSFNQSGECRWTMALSPDTSTTTYPAYTPGGNGDEGGHRIDEPTERPVRPLIKCFNLSNGNVIRFFHNQSGTNLIYAWYAHILAFPV